MRGLKLKSIVRIVKQTESHPSRVRGLKHPKQASSKVVLSVAPFTGAWVETVFRLDGEMYLVSRTLHGCVG